MAVRNSPGAVRIPFKRAAAVTALSLPRFTATGMNAIPAPTEGMIIWNTTENCAYVYDGVSWVQLPMATP